MAHVGQERVPVLDEFAITGELGSRMIDDTIEFKIGP